MFQNVNRLEKDTYAALLQGYFISTETLAIYEMVICVDLVDLPFVLALSWLLADVEHLSPLRTRDRCVLTFSFNTYMTLEEKIIHMIRILQ